MKPDKVNYPTTESAQIASRRAGCKRAAAAARRLVRISGEVLTLGDAAKRAGVSNGTMTTWYSRGVRTWEAFAARRAKSA